MNNFNCFEYNIAYKADKRCVKEIANLFVVDYANLRIEFSK
jgi:hypothetical protein